MHACPPNLVLGPESVSGVRALRSPRSVSSTEQPSRVRSQARAWLGSEGRGGAGLPLSLAPPILSQAHARKDARTRLPGPRNARSPRPRPSRDFRWAGSAPELAPGAGSTQQPLLRLLSGAKVPELGQEKVARLRGWASSLKMKSWA